MFLVIFSKKKAKNTIYTHPKMVTHVGKDTTFGYDLGGFLEVCNSFKSGMFNEKVKSIIALEVTPQIYTVQVEFQFYVNGKYSHCGIDHFTWIEKEGKLLIKDILSTEDDPNHFHPEYFGKGKSWHDPKLENVCMSYKMADIVYKRNNKEIINATVGGKLDIFPREDFKDLF